jgi:hypothetical protein
MIAHLFRRRGRLHFSGYLACGLPEHEPLALFVDVGRDFILVGDHFETLYLTGSGPAHFAEFSPDAFAFAARLGYFRFKVLVDRPSVDLGPRLSRRERVDRELAAKASDELATPLDTGPDPTTEDSTNAD